MVLISLLGNLVIILVSNVLGKRLCLHLLINTLGESRSGTKELREMPSIQRTTSIRTKFSNNSRRLVTIFSVTLLITFLLNLILSLIVILS
jgi:hypothetical protein